VEFIIGDQPPKTFKVGETFLIPPYMEHTVKFGPNGGKAIVDLRGGEGQTPDHGSAIPMKSVLPTPSSATNASQRDTFPGAETPTGPDLGESRARPISVFPDTAASARRRVARQDAITSAWAPPGAPRQARAPPAAWCHLSIGRIHKSRRHARRASARSQRPRLPPAALSWPARRARHRRPSASSGVDPLAAVRQRLWL
jgi:hypothetical protein